MLNVQVSVSAPKRPRFLKGITVFVVLALLPIETEARTLKMANTEVFEVDVAGEVVTCAQVGKRAIPGSVSANGKRFTSFAVQVKRLSRKIKNASQRKNAKRLKQRRAALRAMQREGARICAEGTAQGNGLYRGNGDGGSNHESLEPNPTERTPSEIGGITAKIVPCPGLESVGIYPVPNYAGEEVCPGPDAQILFVISSDGSDENDGLSALTPLRSIPRALARLRDGEADWVVAKRGDVWTEELGLRKSSGKDARNPDVLTAYGDVSLGRPRTEILTPDSPTGLKMWAPVGGSLSYITLSGIELRSEYELGGVGVRLLRDSSHIVLHDMRVSRFKDGVVIQGTDGGRHANIALLGNTIDENAPRTGGGHSQGVYATHVCGLILRDNNVLNNGYITRTHPTAGATTFNQGLYFQSDSCEVEDFRRNHVRGNAAAGVQFRSGVKLAEANVFSRNSTQMVLANGTLPQYQGNHSVIRRNVLVEGSYLRNVDDPGDLPKVGIYLRGALFQAYDNLSSDMLKHIEGALCDSSYRRGACNMHFTSNYFVNGRAHRETSVFARIASSNFVHEDFVGAVFTNNVLFLPHFAPTSSAGDSGPDMIFQFNRPEGTEHLAEWDLEIGNNLYVNGYAADGNENMFRNGKTRINMREWKSGFGNGQPAIEPSAITMVSASLKDPCRTIATYVDDVIDGNTSNNNCAIMNDDELYRRFDRELVKLHRFSNPSLQKLYSAVSVLNYIRDGLSLPPVSGEQE